MKNTILILVLFELVGCQQLMKGQEQPVLRLGVKEPVFFTTCSGAAEDWGSCNRKALATCEKGYVQVKKFETPVGGRRELTFQCK